MAFGKEFKRLRIKAGISAAEAAKWIGVNDERLRKWEQRDADPKDLNDIQKIEDYFETQIGKLDNLDFFNFFNPELLTSAERTQRERRKQERNKKGMPVFESAPVTLTNIKSIRDEKQGEPDFWLNIPQYRNCDYATRAKGDSMHPLIRNMAIVGGRQIYDFNVIVFGDIYIIHTQNGIETVKYIHPDPDNSDGILLVPYNGSAKSTPLHRKDILRLYQAEFVLNPL